MKRVTADFETRSARDLRRSGSYVYSLDPTTEVMCLAWTYDDDPDVCLWHPAYPEAGIGPMGEDELEVLLEEVALGIEFHAHNAFFERCVWNNVCTPRMGWPALDPGQLYCTAAKAAACALPRKLEDACVALGLAQQKDPKGHRLVLKLSKPRKPRKAELRETGCADVDEYTMLYGHIWHEGQKDRGDLFDFFDYCRQDVRAERALDRALPDLCPLERDVWLLDQEMNWRGVAIDRTGVERALVLADEERAAIDEEVRDATFGAVQRASLREPFKAWMADEGHLLPNTRAETIDEWLDREDLPDYVLRILGLWRSYNRNSTKKYVAMLERLPADGRVRDILRYCAASTGRWGGAGIQPQNFPRGFGPGDAAKGKPSMDEVWNDVKLFPLEWLRAKYGDPMEMLALALRGAICAAPGHELLVADYSAIEARVLFWIAGAKRALEVLAGGHCIYRDMAGAIYDVPNPQSIPKDSPKRQLGKQAILGLGYQMGGPKFQVTCAGYGIEVDEEFAGAVVRLYRETYPEVPRLWRAMEAAAVAAARNPGSRVRCSNTTWGTSRYGFLHCRLPSGRLLSYYDPKVVAGQTPWGEPVPKLTFMGVDSRTHQWCRQHTYGGKLVENVVQAASRDLMAEAMLRCRDAGYPPVLTVHDEIVAEVPEGHGDVREFEGIMAAMPEWAEGCPVEAEGWRHRRYRK